MSAEDRVSLEASFPSCKMATAVHRMYRSGRIAKGTSSSFLHTQIQPGKPDPTELCTSGKSCEGCLGFVFTTASFKRYSVD